MRKSGKFLRLPVINVDENEKIGTVTGFVTDPKAKAVAALIVEPVKPLDGLRAVPYENVFSVYDTAIMAQGLPEPVKVSETQRLLSAFLEDVNLPGARVTTAEGAAAGIVRDFIVDDGTGRIMELHVTLGKGLGASVVKRDDIVRMSNEGVTVHRMVAGKALEAEPTARVEPPAAAHAAVSSSMTGGPGEAAAPMPSAAVQQAAVPAAAFPTRGFLDEVKKEVRSEMTLIFDTLFSERMRESFLEMLQIILERIKSLTPGEDLRSLRNDLAARMLELKESLPEKSAAEEQRRREIEDQLGAITLVLEEKIKQVAGARIDSMSERIRQLETEIRRVGAAPDSILRSMSGIDEALGRRLESFEAGFREEGRKSAAELLNTVREIKGLAERTLREPPHESGVARLASRFDALSLQLERLEKTLADSRADAAGRAEQAALRIVNGLKEELTDAVSPLLDSLRSQVAKGAESLEKWEKNIHRAGTPDDAQINTIAAEIRKTLPAIAADIVKGLASEAVGDAAKEIPSYGEMRELFSGMNERLELFLQAKIAERIDEAGEKILARLSSGISRLEEKIPTRNNLDLLGESLKEEVSRMWNEENIALLLESLAELMRGAMVELTGAATRRMEERLEEIIKKSAGGTVEAADMERVLDAARSLSGTLASDIRNLRESLPALVEESFDRLRVESLVPRLESEIGGIREFVEGALEQFVRSRSSEREEEREALVERIDELLKKNLRGRLESFLAKQVDEGMNNLLERLSLRQESGGMFGFLTPRPRQREKTDRQPEKPRLSERAESAADRRLEYIIGKKVGRDIVNSDGVTIVPQGTVVDEDLIARLRRERRLIDLIQCIDYTQ
ncbi:MAG: PRC-barrel domain-containing protein [bacterium]